MYSIPPPKARVGTSQPAHVPTFGMPAGDWCVRTGEDDGSKQWWAWQAAGGWPAVWCVQLDVRCDSDLSCQGN